MAVSGVTKVYVTQPVDGHDPVTEHVVAADGHEREGWRLACSCGAVGKVRPSVELANADRFEHEESIGMLIEAKSGAK